MAYSCNYPIMHTFNASGNETITYQILIGNTVLRNGKILPYSTTDKTIDVDISEVCREYLDTNYEAIIALTGIQGVNIPNQQPFGHVLTFTVSSSYNAATEDDGSGGTEDGANVSYQVVYDYNTDRKSQTEYMDVLPNVRYTNAPIDNILDPRQKVFACGFNLNNTNQIFSYQRNNLNPVTATVTASALAKVYSVNLYNIVNLTSGDTLTLRMGAVGSEAGIDVYNVVSECRNRYALYYVNKFGGLDTLLCTGRFTESWNPTRVDVRLYNNRTSRLDWEQKRIHSEQDHSLQLNTGLLDNERADRIDHLIYSPKVFLHDLDENTISTVIVTDTTYAVKRRPYDKVQYTINVKESQKQLRR